MDPIMNAPYEAATHDTGPVPAGAPAPTQQSAGAGSYAAAGAHDREAASASDVLLQVQRDQDAISQSLRAVTPGLESAKAALAAATPKARPQSLARTPRERDHARPRDGPKTPRTKTPVSQKWRIVTPAIYRRRPAAAGAAEETMSTADADRDGAAEAEAADGSSSDGHSYRVTTQRRGRGPPSSAASVAQSAIFRAPLSQTTMSKTRMTRRDGKHKWNLNQHGSKWKKDEKNVRAVPYAEKPPLSDVEAPDRYPLRDWIKESDEKNVRGWAAKTGDGYHTKTLHDCETNKEMRFWRWKAAVLDDVS